MKRDFAAPAPGLPKPLRVFLALSVALNGLCVAIMEGQKHLLHRGFPYSFPFLSAPGFVDLLVFRPRFQHIHQLDFFAGAPNVSDRFLYPAPDTFLYAFFYMGGRHVIALFLVVTMTLLLALAVTLGRQMVRRGVASRMTFVFLSSSALLSYPLWFEYGLGNMEICIFVIVAFGIIAFLRNKPAWSATLIGLAAALKIFPFVYMALLFTRRKYKELALGIAVIAIAELAALWFLGPSLSIAYHGVRSGAAYFQQWYVRQLHPVEIGFDHSLFGLIKAVAYYFIGWIMPERLVRVYLAFVSIAGLALYFLRIRFLPVLNQVLCLTIASILFPPVSHDYTLLHLYVPWALFVLYALDQARATGTTDKRILPVFLCFAVLLSAESELVYKGLGHSGQLKAIVLMVLLYIGLKYPFAPAEKQFRGMTPAVEFLP
ncbi:MAG TPA: glycosyltransferase family 87 protein [Acidobacteriaceae bacterium]|nr:glycosyltransferase family 87 protein [Acidobacteriaceae bacterium]